MCPLPRLVHLYPAITRTAVHWNQRNGWCLTKIGELFTTSFFSLFSKKKRQAAKVVWGIMGCFPCRPIFSVFNPLFSSLHPFFWLNSLLIDPVIADTDFFLALSGVHSYSSGATWQLLPFCPSFSSSPAKLQRPHMLPHFSLLLAFLAVLGFPSLRLLLLSRPALSDSIRYQSDK